MNTYKKGEKPLHETLTMCLRVLREHAIEDIGEDPRTTLVRSIDGLSQGAARMFVNELVGLRRITVADGGYYVDDTNAVIPSEISAARSKSAGKIRPAVARVSSAKKHAMAASKPTPVGEDELMRAYHALASQQGTDGTSPRAKMPSGRKSANSAIVVSLGVSQRRATTLLGHLLRRGMIELIEHSASVRVMPLANDMQQTASSITQREGLEAVKATLRSLLAENKALKSRVSDLEAQVAELQKRVKQLEQVELDPELANLLKEVSDVLAA